MRRLILLFLILPTGALGQAGVWGLRGITRRLLVRGTQVYAIDGRGVARYDATTLQKIDARETEAESIDAAFMGDTLVVLTGAGFERFDAGTLAPTDTQPAAPATRIASNGKLVATAGPDGVRIYDGGLRLTSIWPQTQRITALAWRGDALFVAADGIGLPVLDGTTATEIGNAGENAVDIAVDGDFLYCAAGKSGLAIYDVHDPANARLISRTGTGEGYFQLAAVANGRAAVGDELKRVRVFDVAAPAEPRALAPIAQPVEAIAASATRLFVSGSAFDDFGFETATGIPVRAYDMAQTVVAEAHDLAGPVSGAATDGTLAFVSDPPLFRVIDVSTTSEPREIASLLVDNIEPYVKSLGSRVILYGRGPVQFIDISNPYRPRLAGTYQSQGRPPSAAAIARDRFLEGNTSSGFHVFDFFPDGSARFIAGIKTHPVDIVARGDAVYYIVEWQSVGVADISDGARLVKAIVIPAIQLALTEDLLLVRDLNAVHVFSVADPLDPVKVNMVPLERGGVIAADGTAAYVAANGTILRMDLGSPALTAFQPTGMRVVAPSQISAANGKIVVADRYGLRVFGTDSAPPPPKPIARRRPARP